MDVKRAKEIIESPGYIDVFFMGSLIWLTTINEERMTADVAQSRYTTSRTREVPVNDLIEGEKLY
jgi:H-type small acid-soluble spore protein